MNENKPNPEVVGSRQCFQNMFALKQSLDSLDQMSVQCFVDIWKCSSKFLMKMFAQRLKHFNQNA